MMKGILNDFNNHICLNFNLYGMSLPRRFEKKSPGNLFKNTLFMVLLKKSKGLENWSCHRFNVNRKKPYLKLLLFIPFYR